MRTEWVGRDGRASDPRNWSDGVPSSGDEAVITGGWTIIWDLDQTDIVINLDNFDGVILIDSSCFWQGTYWGPEAIRKYQRKQVDRWLESKEEPPPSWSEYVIGDGVYDRQWVKEHGAEGLKEALNIEAGATKTWAATAAGNWNTSGNWSPSGVPAAGDAVIFNNTSTYNCTVNVATNSLASFTITSGYTGILTINYTINVAGNVSVSGGTYAGSEGFNVTATSTFSSTGTVPKLTVNGSGITVSLGANLTATTLTITAGTLTTTASNYSLTISGTSSITGTLTPNTSTCTFNGAVTVNSGGTLGGNTAWTCDCNANLTINSGGTFSAPNASGIFTLAGQLWNGGTLNHNSGLLKVDGGGGIYGSSTLYNLTFDSGGSSTYLYTGISAVVENSLTIASGTPTWIGHNTTLTLGTASASATMVIAGTFRCTRTGNVPTVTIQGVSSSYLAGVNRSGVWDWTNDYDTASIWNLKWLDMQFDVTTNGSGNRKVTINITGNMTIDGFTVSAGDTLSCTTAGTTISIAGSKTVQIYGSMALLGSSGNNIVLSSFTSTRFWNNSNCNFQYVSINAYYGVNFFSFSGTITMFDNVSITSTAEAFSSQYQGSTIVTATNSTFISSESITWRRDVTLFSGVKIQLQNCTFDTVGMEATSGWLVSKNHNGTANDYRVWGILNASSPSASYQIANTDNVTLKKADAYGTEFDTQLTIDQNETCASLAINNGTKLYLNSGKTFTLNGSATMVGQMYVNGKMYFTAGGGINSATSMTGTLGGTGYIYGTAEKPVLLYFSSLHVNADLKLIYGDAFFDAVGGGILYPCPRRGIDADADVDSVSHLGPNYIGQVRI